MQDYIEIWKDIPNYEGRYQISNLGNVKSLKFGKDKILKPQEDGGGYMRICLCKEGDVKKISVHRLVILAFVGASDMEVNHVNGIKTDNRLDNLEYCTRSENIQHSYDIGLRLKGEKHYASKLTRACAELIKYGHKGISQKEVANIYGVSQILISQIRSGKKWKHI
jgi:hypothetical protein